TYSGGLANAPADDGTTISCPGDAANPGNPGDILDACGRTVHSVLVVSTTAPTCNGSVVWTYRYTACDGTTTHDWHYTYTITYSRSEERRVGKECTTISCPGDAANQGNPGDILDACGRTVHAELVGSTTAPKCN